MANYKEYKQLNLPAIDKEILDFWNKENIFDRSVENRKGAESFVFYEGPPSANGKPGIHHVLARTVKDLFCRFHTMQGKLVERKGGWDTHGLPIELSVEKELGITKEDIGVKISVDEYNAKCRETVMQFKDQWDDVTTKMGYWVDLENPYVTFENEYIESVWYLLQKLYKKDFLYKGDTIQPYSPAAGTGLSTHELNQPGCYKDVKDTSAVAQFRPVKNQQSAFLFENDNEDVCFLAWTTTPWTLPSNTALAVGKKIDYVKVKTFNQYTHQAVSVIMAKALVKKWFKPGAEELSMEDFKAGDKKIPYRITQEMKGSDLVGIRYEQLLPFAKPQDGDAFVVLSGSFVSTEDGTGIVHIAPSFGADDRKVGNENGIGYLTLVDRQGKFTDNVGEFSGRYVKNYKDDPDYVSVDIDIAIKLKKENKAFNVQKYSHNYPHCWRTDKPILYYPLDSWFVQVTKVKDRMVELNKTINWKPAHTGEKRFGNWLENLQDWNLSRSRYWGIPLPIWRTEDNEVEKCIGSIAELRAEVEKSVAAGYMKAPLAEDFDLHRPYIDDVVLTADDGRPMHRELDLIDVWFDSGSMPYAQWHYPFENEEVFQRNFPADFIAEGVDQTRGWFYTLHAIGVMCFDSVAYKNVVSNGLVLAKDGAKMSKSKGNAVDPFTTIAKYGADATRWYMISNAQPWDNLRFDLEGIDEVRRKFFGTLYNTYNFFAMYANVDNFNYGSGKMPLADRPELDRWVISKLNSLIKEVEEDYSAYEPTRATRKIQSFVGDHLSNWYVRLGRRRYWKGEQNDDKRAAYQTLYECMLAISKLMAPVAPFFADFLYTNLNGITQLEKFSSVHLANFPELDSAAIDKDLEQRMDYAQRACSLVLSLRKKEKIRVRQPLSKILLPILDASFKDQVEQVKDLILSEVNVKDIEYITDASGFIKKKIKPNFKTLGRRMGKQMKAVAQLVNGFTADDIASIEKNQGYDLELDGVAYRLEMEDFLITSEDIPGWQVAQDGDLTVALDVSLNEELQAEGLAREMVNRIQKIRKDSGFNVTDRINLIMLRHDKMTTSLDLFKEYICNEVLATSFEVVETMEGGLDIQLVDDLVVKVKVGLN